MPETIAQSHYADAYQSRWTEEQTPDGRIYYFDATSNDSKWEKPIQLKTEEEIAVDNITSGKWVKYKIWDGREYYYSKEMDMSTWEVPEEIQIALEKIRGFEETVDDCKVDVSHQALLDAKQENDKRKASEPVRVDYVVQTERSADMGPLDLFTLGEKEMAFKRLLIDIKAEEMTFKEFELKAHADYRLQLVDEFDREHFYLEHCSAFCEKKDEKDQAFYDALLTRLPEVLKGEENKTGKDLAHCELTYEELPDHLKEIIDPNAFEVCLYRAALQHVNDHQKINAYKEQITKQLKHYFQTAMDNRLITCPDAPFHHVRRFLRELLIPLFYIVAKNVESRIFALRRERTPLLAEIEKERVNYLRPFETNLLLRAWKEFVQECKEVADKQDLERKANSEALRRKARRNRDAFFRLLEGAHKKHELNENTTFVELITMYQDDNRSQQMVDNRGSSMRDLFEQYREGLRGNLVNLS